MSFLLIVWSTLYVYLWLQHRTMQSSSYSLLNPEVQTKAAAPLPEGRAKATKGCYEESTPEKTEECLHPPQYFKLVI